MIFIDRHKVPVPAELSAEQGAVQREKAKALAYYKAIKKAEKQGLPARKRKRGDPVLPKTKFTFNAYNSPGIKRALLALFHEKCAYCETKVSVAAMGDVEHYRPKAEILDEDNKKIVPGYYWLAYDWDNLLLSCEPCNRKSSQVVETGEEEVMGKGNQFPMLKGAIRCLDDDKDVYEIEKASRLLLNPCIDQPELHLNFLENGAIQALHLQDGTSSQIGETSIKVYALYRKPLVDERLKLYKAILVHIGELKFFARALADAKRNNDEEKKQELDELLKNKVGILNAYQDDKEIYAALARQIIRPFLKENNLI